MPIFENREQLVSRMQTLIGDRTDDEALNFIQDALETYDSRTSNSGGISNEEHTRLMNEQDETWRKRYRDAFFTGPDESLKDQSRSKSKSDPADELPGRTENNPASYDELFG